MADNAIDKLFEEMRAARAAYEDAVQRQKAASEERDLAAKDALKAYERQTLLQQTLDTHIYEGEPIVQATMIAHEKQAEEAGQMTAVSGSTIVSGTIASNTIQVGSLSTTKIKAGSIMSNPRWTF